MPLFLKHRNITDLEWMDRPDCDLDKLYKTYQYFDLINRYLSRWKWIYTHYLKPHLKKDNPNTLLDIGFGGADIIRYIDQWSKKDGYDVRITGIETDQRALDYVKRQSWPSNIQFKKESVTKLVTDHQTFDFIISNHLLHHLAKEEIIQLFKESEILCRKEVLFNDIQRSDLGYLLFKIITTPFFRDSFISYDGQLSIKRSFTFNEMKDLVPNTWAIHRISPYRLLIEYHK